MPHELKYTEVEIPELDAFLREYESLCEKHGMAFETGSYSYDGGHYTTIGKPSGAPYLDLEYADEKIPCIADALVRVDAIRSIRDEKDRKENAVRSAADEQRLYARLKAKYETSG